MASLPYMPLYPGDYHRDTQHLTTLEHGAYFLLIMAYWSRGEPLPDTDRKLAGIAKLPMPEWQDIRSELAEFFTVEDGLWKHPRIDAELAKAHGKVEVARKAGEESARRRADWRARQAEQAGRWGTGVGRTLNDRSTNQHHLQNQNQPQSEEEKGSVDADASTGAAAPGLDLIDGFASLPDPADFANKVDWFFHPAVVSFMCSGGANERNARAFIGKVRATLGETFAAKRIRQAFDERVSDPIGWLQAKLPKARANTGVNRRTFDDVDYGESGRL